MGLRGPGAAKLSAARKSFKRDGDAPQLELLSFPTQGASRPWADVSLTRAERVIAFLETLPITSGPLAGELFTLRDWQRDIITALYELRDDGRRLKRHALITIPRKNGKTALVAGLCLAHLLGPEAEARGQCYSAASDRDQAALIFNEMEAMILQTPDLAQRVNIQRFAKKIEDLETGSTYQALSADARKAHGLNVSFFVYDELAQAPNRNLYDFLVTGTGGRAEPLSVVISTQSSDPNHVMSELVDYGQQVLDGVVDDPAFLPVIYAAPETADIWDEDVWGACNPALGDFRSLDEMRESAARAKRIPSQEAAFRNLYLNQRIDPETRFITAKEWDACAEALPLERLKGRKCWGGLDLGSTRDLTALVLAFPDDVGGVDVVPFFWCPKAQMSIRAEQDRAPYPEWTRAGFMEATPGASTNYAYVVHRLGELSALYDIQAVAYDRWRIEDLKRLLDEEGVKIALEPFGPKVLRTWRQRLTP